MTTRTKATQQDQRLGQYDFADWYQNPIFDSDSDERIEELASAGRGPVRLVAAALLRIEAVLSRRSESSVPSLAAPRFDARSTEGTPVRTRASKPRQLAPKTKTKRNRQFDPRHAPVDETAWASWSSGAADNGLAHATAELDHDRRPARRSLSHILDTWAEKETLAGMRLEQALLSWFRRS